MRNILINHTFETKIRFKWDLGEQTGLELRYGSDPPHEVSCQGLVNEWMNCAGVADSSCVVVNDAISHEGNSYAIVYDRQIDVGSNCQQPRGC